MKLELFDFQKQDVDRFIAEGHKGGLFGYDMALGKTLTSTTLTIELGAKRNLIVAPKNTFRGWAKAVHTQTEGEQELRWIKMDTKAGVKALEDYYAGKPGWYFITWGLMRGGMLFETEVDMLIADEVHEIQNKGGSDQNIQLGEIRSEYRVGLSGTASGNKLAGIYGVISWIWPARYKAYWPWLKKHFLLAGFGHALSPIREKTPGTVTADLPFYVRRLKEDHYQDMIPEPHKPVEFFVDMSDKQREIYDQFERTSGAWLGETEEDGFVFSQYSITKAMRLREIALGNPVMTEENGNWITTFPLDTQSAKLDKLIEILESEEFGGETAVVYTHSKKFIKVVVDRLNKRGISAREFTGDLTTRQKDKNIDELGDKYRVMVATQASVGVGVDGLQHKSRNLIILSRDVKVINNTQGRDRLYRPGQTQKMRTFEIIANNSNDLDTNSKIDYAEEMVNNMLNANKKSRGE